MKIYEKKSITLNYALKLAQKAISLSEDMGYYICVTIVDESGIVKVSLRNDKANYITPDSSRKKAYTAAAIGFPTNNMVKMIEKEPHMQQFSNITNDTILYGGGVPIKSGDLVIGAIGIAGAPGGDLDHEIAVKTISKEDITSFV